MYTFRKNNIPNLEIHQPHPTVRKYKSKRNASLPDMQLLIKECHSRSKEKLKYNKWYIKPELRLKTCVFEQPNFKQNADRLSHYYQSLYSTPATIESENLQRKSQKKVRINLAQQLCADLQNIRLLQTFKIKKQGRKRIPGVVDYFLNYKQQQSIQSKKSGLKRKVIMC